jgi:hypothetical protein
MKLVKGNYARVKMAANTRMGLIDGSKTERGITHYHFLQDERFKEVGPVYEAWIPEEELEACTRPPDEYWKQINELAKRGS